MSEADLDPLQTRHEDHLAERTARPAGARPHGRALCLSGGGYRAALFHLGALLRLHERGLLAELELVSSVSGGSIVSAWLARRYVDTRGQSVTFADWCRRIDFRAAVVEPFRAVVGRDIRTWPVLATLPFNWLLPQWRVERLQAAYTRFLGDLRLGDLPEQPRFVFCATDLTFGVNWEFARDRVGDYLAGYLQSRHALPVALAVAASSSFPPLFGPVRLDLEPTELRRGRYRGSDGDRLRSAIELSDGGVYDNLGIEPALRRYREVLVSDAGAPFAFRPGRTWLRRLLRYTQVIGNQAVALRKRLLFLLYAQHEFAGAYWNLGDRIDAGAAGYSPSLVRELLARIRTDLDRFDDDEFEVLVNHGYFACEDGLLARRSPLPAAAAHWPYPDQADEAQVRRRLAGSHRRFRPWRRRRS